METAEKLTNLQLEILKLYRYEVSDVQLREIKNLPADYFAKYATEEMDRLWVENNWDNNTMKDWASEHLRSSGK